MVVLEPLAVALDMVQILAVAHPGLEALRCNNALFLLRHDDLLLLCATRIPQSVIACAASPPPTAPAYPRPPPPSNPSHDRVRAPPSAQSSPQIRGTSISTRL